MTERIRRLNPATGLLLAILFAAFVAQTLDPGLVDRLGRNPEELADGEWWRVATPLLVQEAGPVSALILVIFLGWLGTTIEPIVGSAAILILFVVGAVAGELAGYAWHPYGSGSSVAIAGLVGAFVILLADRSNPLGADPRLRRIAPLGAAAILLGAVALTVIQDVHGPPILAGAVVYLLIRRVRAPTPLPGAERG